MNRTLIAAALLGASLVSGGMLIQGVAWTEADAASASPRLFEQVMERIRRDYIDTISTDQMLRLAAIGVPVEVDERYSKLLPPDRVGRIRENGRGRQAGVGLEVDIRDGFVTVVAPIAGTPADSAGIEPGDHLVSINGKSTYDLTIEEVEQALQGPAATTVELAVDRDEVSQTYRLMRRMIVSHAVRRAEVFAPGVGYVKLATITADAADELQAAIQGRGRRAEGGSNAGSSLQPPLSSLILDLRENPGGKLEHGIRVADLFLDQGQEIVSTRGRTPDVNREYTDRVKQPWPAMPIVVLVDSGTASAAEVVAGALKDNNRAVLVGSPTYGKGSAQSLLPVTGGYALKLTTERWFTPKGRPIERDSVAGGIEPDVVVRKPEAPQTRPQQDPVIQRAMELLRGVKNPADLRGRVPAPSPKRD